MIENGDVIKHKAFKDVAVQVLFSNQNPETKDIEIQGVWLNQGQIASYSINEPAKFTIKEKHISNWLRCSKPESLTLRSEEWKELK